ncbi:MAG: 30S ribosomal protein S20 [Proteobacteria bacterium]|nr:30S ribosomal protein S20 [Pseudomonadota bacterium]
MANHPSAKKRHRRAEKRTVVNHARLSRIRTFLKRVEAAIAAGDKEQAVAAFRLAQPELMRGVSKGLVHRNTSARTLSRLSARIKALQAPAAAP